MAKGLNKIQIIGNLGADPEFMDYEDGFSTARFSVAVTEEWKDKNGEKQSRTEWFRVSLFYRLAEVAAQYLKKGSKVYIEGKFQSSEYENDLGEKKQSHEIRGMNLIMLDSKKSSENETTDDTPF